MTPKIIIHYCCGSYDHGAHGGVPRYDYHIKLAFPRRIFVMGPKQKIPLLQFLEKHKGNVLVITDNHLACDIPNDVPVFLVHHGVAQTHAAREPEWNKYWRDLCCSGQKEMLYHRDPSSTTIISISQFCTDEFTKYYNEVYTRFKSTKILHTSELDETRYKKEWNNKPVVLGNWQGVNKGAVAIQKLVNNSNDFKFNQLRVGIDQRGIDNFNQRKQNIYLNSDIFLQISNSEGFSYAALDAVLCGLPLVSSNVGFCYNDMPEDCFVKLDWRKNGDVEYVKSKLRYAWKNREELARKGREWYMKNCRFVDWKKKMRNVISQTPKS